MTFDHDTPTYPITIRRPLPKGVVDHRDGWFSVRCDAITTDAETSLREAGGEAKDDIVAPVCVWLPGETRFERVDGYTLIRLSTGSVLHLDGGVVGQGVLA